MLLYSDDHTTSDKDVAFVASPNRQATYEYPATVLTTQLKHSSPEPHHSRSAISPYYSPTLVPAPTEHHEALSSLISSLTSISDAQRTISSDQPPRPRTAGVTTNRSQDFSPEFDFNPQLRHAFDQAHNFDSFFEHDDEPEACPPPVAGYNTINTGSQTPRPKTAIAETASVKPTRAGFRERIKHSKSQGNIKGSTTKPLRELKTPESYQSSHYTRSSVGDASLTSLPLSTKSKSSGTKSSFKMFFSTRLGHDTGVPARQVESSLDESTYESALSSPVKNTETRGFSAFVAIRQMSLDVDRPDADARTLSSLSPTLMSDLGENLIPSRRSSLRGGPGQRSSRSSKDLKSLNIDQDLIEENHETVQRIRELQEARDRRHSEWRKEARKSEKAAAKRLSNPLSNPIPILTPNPQPSSPFKVPPPRSRSSWQAKALDSSDAEPTPRMSATLTGNDLNLMPAFVEADEGEPLTPVEHSSSEQQDSPLRRNPSVTGSMTPSLPGTKRHRRKLSDSLRRVSMRSPLPDDARGVQDEVDAYLGSPRLTQKIRHPRTGRTIAFSEVGDPEGFVVLCCVGMGLTRYVSSFYDDIARTHRLRFITPDRPGVGETEALPPERTNPLSWVDDVAVICTSLGIEKFSLLAHSAGAIYALATALKMPQYIRGRIHLLGPWIPPSVLATSGKQGSIKAVNLPTSHKLLSLLPVSFMKAANSRFLSATSVGMESRATKDRRRETDLQLGGEAFEQHASLSSADFTKGYMLSAMESKQSYAQPSRSQSSANYSIDPLRSPPRSPTPGSIHPPFRSQTFSPTPTSASMPGSRAVSRQATAPVLSPEARQRLYNTTLAHRTWSLATLNANPAQDLVICLERKKPIGFRYTDITRAVVIHHGVNDTRVPLENIEWLSRNMKRCELRVLENEGHGLMASASVMANVLADIGKEWEEWSVIVDEKEKDRKRQEEIEAKAAQERERAFRRGYPKW